MGFGARLRVPRNGEGRSFGRIGRRHGLGSVPASTPAAGTQAVSTPSHHSSQLAGYPVLRPKGSVVVCSKTSVGTIRVCRSETGFPSIDPSKAFARPRPVSRTSSWTT